MDTSFENLKQGVHLLIERMEISHTSKDKGGEYYIKIKYKGFDEFSLFITDWKALSWVWLSYTRKGALNEVQLNEDREMTKALFANKGITLDDNDIEELQKKSGMKLEEIEKQDYRSNKFEGSEVTSFFKETVELKKEELLNF